AVEIVVDGVAESLAARAGAGGRVEAEQNRLRRGELGEAGLALELLVKAETLIAGGAFEDHLARLAGADLDRIDEPLMQVGANGDAVHKHVERLGEIDIQERLRGGELEKPSALEQPVEAFLAQLEQVIAQRLRGAVIAGGEDGVPAGAGGEFEKACGD